MDGKGVVGLGGAEPPYQTVPLSLIMLGTQGPASNAANRNGTGCWVDGVEQMEQWNSRFLYYSPTFSRQENFLMILLFHLFHWLCTYKIPTEYKTECH